MNLLDIIQSDYDVEYRQSQYPTHSKKVFHVLTSTGFQAVFLFRLAHWLGQKNVPLLGAMLQRISEIWCGVSISPKAQIGPGFLIYHFGGIFINGSAVLGKDCVVHHEVTIGNRKPGGPNPILGDRVMVGAGAKILGGVKIGDDAEIGANAVVLKDVPAGGIAVGVPANVVRVKQ